jgi:hypothetical protein
LLKGHIESLKEDCGLGFYNGKFEDIIKVLDSKKFLNYLDFNSGMELIDVK